MTIAKSDKYLRGDNLRKFVDFIDNHKISQKKISDLLDISSSTLSTIFSVIRKNKSKQSKFKKSFAEKVLTDYINHTSDLCTIRLEQSVDFQDITNNIQCECVQLMKTLELSNIENIEDYIEAQKVYREDNFTREYEFTKVKNK